MIGNKLIQIADKRREGYRAGAFLLNYLSYVTSEFQVELFKKNVSGLTTIFDGPKINSNQFNYAYQKDFLTVFPIKQNFTFDFTFHFELVHSEALCSSLVFSIGTSILCCKCQWKLPLPTISC